MKIYSIQSQKLNYRMVSHQNNLFFSRQIQMRSLGQYNENSQLLIMQFGQSRLNSRGALIAVIKIEIDTEKTDRIFLHQNDDDYKLAIEFVEKHQLDSALVQHIYDRITFSRKSVQAKLPKQMVTPQQYLHSQTRPQYNQQYRQVTPYQNLLSHKEQHSFEQSFGHHLVKPQNEPAKNPSVFQTNDDTYSKHKYKIQVKDNEFFDAPVKKLFQDEKEFRLYSNEEAEQEEVPVKLFPSEPQLKQPQKQKLQSPPPKSSYNRAYDTAHGQRRKNQQFIQPRQTVADYLKSSKSVPKFNSNQRMHSKPDQPILTRQASSAKKNSDYDKPLHVKILRKQEIQSLNQSLKKSMSKQEISRINKDVTSRLYNEGQIKKNYLNIIKQKVKKQKEKEKIEDLELTHRPEINKISKVIAEGRRKNDIPVEKYLIQQGKKAELKRQEQANKRYLQQIENCTFEPQLNLISKKLAAEKGNFESRMSENKFKKSKYKDENLFRPSLGQVTYELMKDKGSFQARQRQFLEQKNSRLVEKVKEKRTNEKIDPFTGQQLFKPKIHDLGVRESQGTNIGNYLFELSKQPSLQTNNSSLHHPKINDYSANIVKQMQFRRIAWLFSELDSDQDGLISAQKINISAIPSELLNIIKPILFEMEQINQELNLNQFNNSVEMLHKQLTTYERNILYHYKQSKVK